MRIPQQADIVFYGTIESEGDTVDNVLCRLYLPLKLTDTIEIHLQPNSEQFKTLKEFWRFSIRGEVRGYEDRIEKMISANEVIALNSNTRHHGFGLSETLLFGEPRDLKITDMLYDHTETNKADGKFWLTPNHLLEPYGNVSNSYTGKREFEVKRQFSFQPDNEIKFDFERHYRHYENENGDDISFSELVASFEIEDANNESPKINASFDKLNDVLLLASFAAMSRCVCLGWDSYDGNTFVKQYLRNIAMPEIAKSKRLRTSDEIIDLVNFDEFMKTAYSNLLNYAEIPALRRAINLIIPSKRATVDGGFMVMYSALEMLVLHFRRNKGLEFILPKSSFEKHIRKDLKDYIDKSGLPDLTPDKKQMMKDKLSELNRVSFAAAFRDFCAYYSVSLDDLWTVTGDGKGVSLSQIRNKLVHGEHFDSTHYGALIYAKEHLKWIIQRMILGILGWSLEKSNISPNKLMSFHAYLYWRDDQKLLSK